MSQLWHIFKKDVRYLRLEICLLFILTSAYAWSETREPPSLTNGRNALLPLALILLSILIIARLVHAESIPGDRQFWVTRPYRWKQLLAAKVVFILVFVNGPLLIAQSLIIRAEKFPVLANLSALLWTQVLWFLCLSLPAAALGAITSGLVPFFLSILGFMVINGLLLMSGPLREAFSLYPVGWVRIAAALTVLLVSAVVVLLMQYRYRRTLQMRIFVAVAAAFGIAVNWTLPITFDLEAQTHAAAQPAEMSSIQFVMNPYPQNSQKLDDVTPLNVQSESVWMRLPLALTGAPEGTEVRIDALVYGFEGGDGRSWRLGPIGSASVDRPVESVQTDIFVDSSFFNAEHKMPVTFRATAYLTVFGNAEEKTLAPQPWPAPTNITPQVQCYNIRVYSADPGQLKCRTAFRQPSQLFSAITDNETHPLRFGISYSPFPASLNVNPVQDADFFFAPPKFPVTLIMRQQLAHLRRDLELRNVNLDDFVVRGR